VVDSLFVPNPVFVEEKQFPSALDPESHLLVEEAPHASLLVIGLPEEFIESGSLQILDLGLAGRDTPPDSDLLVNNLLSVGQQFCLDYQIPNYLPVEVLPGDIGTL
jgi:hypothetical protein